MKREKFWMVYSPQGNTPTVMHSSPSVAMGEASRLATANPGQYFYLLEAMAEVKKQDVSVHYYDRPTSDEQPF